MPCIDSFVNLHNKDTCDSVYSHSSILPFLGTKRLGRGIFSLTIAYIHNTIDMVFYQEGFLIESIFSLGIWRTYLFSTTCGFSSLIFLCIIPIEVINNNIAVGSNTKIRLKITHRTTLSRYLTDSSCPYMTSATYLIGPISPSCSSCFLSNGNLSSFNFTISSTIMSISFAISILSSLCLLSI